MKCLTQYSYGLVKVLMVLGFGLNMVGCAKDDSSKGTDAVAEAPVSAQVSDQVLESKTHKNPHKCVKTGEKCFTETFQQPDQNTSAVDVLFVVQTSDAIVPEKAAIVAGIQGFIQSLPENSDFNIAVMLSHGSTSPRSGTLFQVESEPIVLKSSELSNAQIQAYLNTKLSNVIADPDSGGGEEGMFSLFNGITTPALLAASQAQGFFRPQAALGVIFVGDRRDICAVVPVGVPAETDPVKIDARIRDCEGLTAAGLTNRLTLLKGALPLAVSAIIYADEPAPAGNEIGYGYTDMVALNAGVAIDIANDDIAAGLASIAELSGQQMEIQTVFELENDDVIASTVEVRVNGLPATFTVSGNTVTVTSNVPAGSVVEIKYCVKKVVPGPRDCPHHPKGDCWHKWWHSHGKKGHCRPKGHGGNNNGHNGNNNGHSNNHYGNAWSY